MSGHSYEIDELLNEAIITGVPVLIVEGIDDIFIYEKISAGLPFDVEVYAIENIDGFTEGCDQVISAIQDLNALPNSTHPLSDHILGIIDKDVRDYRNEIPEVEPLLVLNYYSIESHFISKQSVFNILSLTSKAGRELVNDELCNLIIAEVEEKLLDLYYFSLESLRNSMDPQYTGSFAYSYAPGRIRDFQTRQSILSKKAELDDFAASLNLTPSVDTLKSISKGKWLLEIFSQELLNSICGLQQKCAHSSIQTCSSCVSQAFDKCLYRIRDGFTKKTVQSLILSNVDGAEVEYVKDRIVSMKV